MQHLKDILVHILGWLFLIAGVVGLLLPFLQGFLFIIIGIYLLSRSSVWFEDKLSKLKLKHPKLAMYIIKVELMVEKLTDKCKDFWRKLFS